MYNKLFVQIKMRILSDLPLDANTAFLYTLGTTAVVALSVMMTRYLNLCSSMVSRKLLHICIVNGSYH